MSVNLRCSLLGIPHFFSKNGRDSMPFGKGASLSHDVLQKIKNKEEYRNFRNIVKQFKGIWNYGFAVE
jgi:hypothetical protein